MIGNPRELLNSGEPSEEVLELDFDSVEPGTRVVIRTDGSIFVLESTHRSQYGTLFGRVTRFSEAPMTSEGGTAYLPDIMIIQEECQLFSGQIIKTSEQMYFHGIHYEGHTYTDESYDVIHTAPIEVIEIIDDSVAV